MKYMKVKNIQAQSLSGFTMIELLVVIVIIGILAAIILPNMLDMRLRAKDSKLKSELRDLKVALQVYYEDNQSYPAAGNGYTLMGCGTSAAPVSCAVGGVFSQDGIIYMQTLPELFLYKQLDGGEGFDIWSTLDNKSDQDAEKSQQKCAVLGAGPQDYYECSN